MAEPGCAIGCEKKKGLEVVAEARKRHAPNRFGLSEPTRTPRSEGSERSEGSKVFGRLAPPSFLFPVSLLGAKGIATRSKDATRSKGHRY